MEFKKFGFYTPKVVTEEIAIMMDNDPEMIKKAEEEFTRLINESSDKIFRQQFGLEPPTSDKIDFKDELNRMLDKFTYLILINISDEDMVKKAIEDLKKKESGINIAYNTNPYIPQGQVVFIEEEELKHQMLNIKRKKDAEKKKEKTDGKRTT